MTPSPSHVCLYGGRRTRKRKKGAKVIEWMNKNRKKVSPVGDPVAHIDRQRAARGLLMGVSTRDVPWADYRLPMGYIIPLQSDWSLSCDLRLDFAR